MKTIKMFVLSAILLMGIGSILYGQEKVSGPTKLSAGVLVGYNRGYGIQANLTLHNATSGEPEKKGRSIDYRLDFLFSKSIFGLPHS